MTDKDKIKNALLKYHVEHDKKFPPKSWICSYTGLMLDQVNSLLNELIEEGSISKYLTNYYLKKEFVNTSKQKKDFIQPIVKQVIAGTKAMTANIFNIKFSMAWFIQLMCFIIAFVSIYVTSSLSFEWARIMFDDHVKAIVLSITLPLFSTFSIEGAILLFKERNTISIIAAIVLVFMMIFAMIFDSSMIVMSQYNKRYTQVKTANKEEVISNKENKKYDLLIKQQATQEKLIKELEDKRNIEQNKFELLKIDDKNYYTQKWYLKVSEDNLTAARNELKKIEGLLNTQIEKTDIEIKKKEDSYTWLANRFGIPVESIEFIIFSVLAVFLVIVAPFAAFVALGMWRTKK